MKLLTFASAVLACAMLCGISAFAEESGNTLTDTAVTSAESTVTESTATSAESTVTESTVTSAESTVTEGAATSVESTNVSVKDEIILSVQELDSDGYGSSDYVNITIDGSYDDWSDKPHSEIRYPWDPSNSAHKGALFRDDEYVYLHIKMSELSYTSFNGNNYRFNVDGTDIFTVVVPPDNVPINSDGITPLVVRAQNGYGMIFDAEGVLSRHPNVSDEWELRIPLQFFSDQPETITSLIFSCSNLGPQELVSAGTSTAPFIIAGVGLGIAALGWRLSEKKKRSGKQV